ncbi:Neural-cadherin [Lepeophtheirus salmonis]|uniref:Neural-cadherin n=1 Tax=Lepeophtheirus salmonis TaxID=72036 RepID=A0A7R8CX93_LEPSM|nr:Neural-cadherin [Lepeophtheirus salmonis]CAF2958617.1 Neural-cadherin [Lepeophtheirus salmonis]
MEYECSAVHGELDTKATVAPIMGPSVAPIIQGDSLNEKNDPFTPSSIDYYSFESSEPPFDISEENQLLVTTTNANSETSPLHNINYGGSGNNTLVPIVHFDCRSGETRIGFTECMEEKKCNCENGGKCHIDQQDFCICPLGYEGNLCQIEVTSLIFGGTDFIIMLAFVLGALLILVLVFVVYNRRREAQIKYPNPDDDVRENIINYEDEGGGEDDMTAFDITPLQIPVPSDPSQPHHAHAAKSGATVIAAGAGHHSLPRAKSSYVSKPVANSNVESFIEDHKSRADNDPSAPPFDDLRNYAYEGGGSTAGSLSSLGSDNDIGPF